MTQREKELKERLEVLNKERRDIESEIRKIHSHDRDDIEKKVVAEHKKYLYRAFVDNGKAYNIFNREDSKGMFLVTYVPDDATPYVLALFVNGIISGFMEVKLFDCEAFHDHPRKLVREEELYVDYKKQMHTRGDVFSEISVDEFWEAYDKHMERLDTLTSMMRDKIYTDEYMEKLGKIYPYGFLGGNIVRTLNTRKEGDLL